MKPAVKRWLHGWRMIVVASAVTIMTTGIGLGVASASIPDGNGVIHACYKAQANGKSTPLGVIDTALPGGQCPSGQTELTWNRTGPRGPQGATGPAGPQGPPGTSVDSGLLTFYPQYNSSGPSCALTRAKGPNSLTATVFYDQNGNALGCTLSGFPSGTILVVNPGLSCSFRDHWFWLSSGQIRA
jgi:hypothetical protein